MKLWGVRLKTLDVWMLRGNLLFGGGVHGEAIMPPAPSVIAGAAASAALAAAGRLAEASANPNRAEAIVEELFGGSFRLRAWALVRNGTPYLPPPADLVLVEEEKGKDFMHDGCMAKKKDKVLKILKLAPRNLPKGVKSSAPTPEVPVLADATRAKPASGYWLSLEGWEKHLQGALPAKEDWIATRKLWTREARLGIALNDEVGRPHEGRIYTTDAVRLEVKEKDAPVQATELWAVFEVGEEPDAPEVWRFGGDARGATAEPLDNEQAERICALGTPPEEARGLRVHAALPLASNGGWLLPGAEKEDGRFVWRHGNVEAELVAAAVPRAEVVSGWDVARHRPKAAVRMIPAGACWWLRLRQGSAKELAEALNNPAGLEQPKSRLRPAREGGMRLWFSAWNLTEEGR